MSMSTPALSASAAASARSPATPWAISSAMAVKSLTITPSNPQRSRSAPRSRAALAVMGTPPRSLNDGMIADHASPDRRLEGRQVDLVKLAPRDVHRGVFPSRRDRPIGAEVLGRGAERRGRRQIVVLEAPHLGPGVERPQPGVFAEAFGDPSPAWIAGHVEHGREGQGDAVGRGLDGGGAGGLLPQSLDRRPQPLPGGWERRSAGRG